MQDEWTLVFLTGNMMKHLVLKFDQLHICIQCIEITATTTPILTLISHPLTSLPLLDIYMFSPAVPHTRWSGLTDHLWLASDILLSSTMKSRSGFSWNTNVGVLDTGLAEIIQNHFCEHESAGLSPPGRLNLEPRNVFQVK